MTMLVVATLATDNAASRPVVIGAELLALGWTAVTIWAARSDSRMRSPLFGATELVVVLLIGVASTAAGARDLFHGGYLTSSISVIAYGWGVVGALILGGLLAIEQVAVHVIDGRALLPALGSINFIVVAVLFGWAYGALRVRESRRLATEAELADEQRARVRFEERAQLADRLHDSVLQTLVALRREAGDPDEVRYLSRRQERELRQTIDEYRSPFDHSCRAALLAACADVEDVYHVEIDAVIRGDAELQAITEPVVAVAHEALTNAAKHAGVDSVDLYAELDSDHSEVWVRDRGPGLGEPASLGPLEDSLNARLAPGTGRVDVSTRPRCGVEVHICVP